jgi:hypothetical protein
VKSLAVEAFGQFRHVGLGRIGGSGHSLSQCEPSLGTLRRHPIGYCGHHPRHRGRQLSHLIIDRLTAAAQVGHSIGLPFGGGEQGDNVI